MAKTNQNSKQSRQPKQPPKKKLKSSAEVRQLLQEGRALRMKTEKELAAANTVTDMGLTFG